VTKQKLIFVLSIGRQWEGQVSIAQGKKEWDKLLGSKLPGMNYAMVGESKGFICVKFKRK